MKLTSWFALLIAEDAASDPQLAQLKEVQEAGDPTF